MSDYISKSALKKYLRDYKWEFALGSDFSKAIEMVDVQPTLDEKEIIRKPFERVVERLKEETKANTKLGCELQAKEFHEGALIRFSKKNAFIEAIEIIKEECGISE